MKRSRLERKMPLRQSQGLQKPRRRIPRESAQRRSERALRAAVVAAALRRDGGCVGPAHGLTGRCVGPLDGHEVKTRARGGSHLDVDNIRTLCRSHHGFITTHPVIAHEVGLMLHSWE